MDLQWACRQGSPTSLAGTPALIGDRTGPASMLALLIGLSA